MHHKVWELLLWLTGLSNYPAFTRDFWNDSILAYILIHLNHHQKSKASGWLTLYSSAQPLFWSRLWLSLALLSPRGQELPSVTSSIYSLSSLRCSLHLFCSKGNLSAAENTASCFSSSFPPSIAHLRQWQASCLLSKTTSTLRPNCRSFETGVACPPQVLAQGSLSSSPLLVLSFLMISTSTQMIH